MFKSIFKKELLFFSKEFHKSFCMSNVFPSKLIVTVMVVLNRQLTGIL